ncbi:hypothetical protein PHPALM_30486 [Phytophthora palmivora]|uniref:PiggyBac transposable element-derived protein domain-containing protein n=1 Tax=Phytophthora palmivora TaxID=4796 RepID=A0A2P4X516_9STRA|nr:hypothetical protein PHPALM_30486 [Phytophthora palmivora]
MFNLYIDAVLFAVSSIMSSGTEDGHNGIEEGEDPEEYGDLDSGDETTEHDIIDVDDPEDIVEDEDNGVSNESFEAISERYIAEKFLGSLGRSERVLVGDVMGQDMDKFRDRSMNGWGFPAYRTCTKNFMVLLPKRWGAIALFFIFMPVPLWQRIAVCGNNYEHEQLEARVEAYIERGNEVLRRHPEDTTSIRTPRDVRTSLMAVQSVLPHKLCLFIELLLARAIQPKREKISNHWKMSGEEGIA